MKPTVLLSRAAGAGRRQSRGSKAGAWCLLLLAASLPCRQPSAAPIAPAPTLPAIAPLYFETNRGQADDGVRFIARGRDCDVLIAPAEAVLVLDEYRETSPGTSLGRVALSGRGFLESRRMRFELEGANPRARVTGIDPLPGKANYFIGSEPAGWLSRVPLFAKVQVDQVYPGVRLVYYANQSAELEYDFLVEPGADPDRISLRFAGVDKVQLDAEGCLVLSLGADEIRQHRPAIYQVVEGKRKTVEGGYRLESEATVGFRIGEYDRRLPLVIDPVLTFAAYLGGKLNDKGWGIAMDAGGNMWVAGETLSKDLRTSNNVDSAAIRTNYMGGHGVFGDAFVARFSSGTNLDYLTYFGGKGQDAAFAVAVDPATGEAFVTGYTDSSNFPIEPTNAFQSRLGGTNLNARRVNPIDTFVTKLNPDGTIAYSTLLGGKSREVGLSIAVDNLGRAYVTGLTESSNYLTTSGLPSLSGSYLQGGTNRNYDGRYYHKPGDAFIARLTADGTGLDYYSYLGGSNLDVGQGVAVDAAYSAYVVGYTLSTNFPITTNSLSLYLNDQTNRSSYSDGFICKLSDSGTNLLYSSYLSGSNTDVALSVAVDTLGNAYVTGYTFSTNFPRTLTNFIAWPSKTNFNCDAFVVKFDANGTTNGGYAVEFGGRSADFGIGIAVDSARNAYIVGSTTSPTNFAGVNEAVMTNFFAANTNTWFSPTNSSVKKLGTNDVFVVQLDPDGNHLFSAYLGRAGSEQANGIALDPGATNVAICIVGTTTSTNFPATAAGTFHGGKKKSDAFVGRIEFP